MLPMEWLETMWSGFGGQEWRMLWQRQAKRIGRVVQPRGTEFARRRRATLEMVGQQDGFLGQGEPVIMPGFKADRSLRSRAPGEVAR